MTRSPELIGPSTVSNGAGWVPGLTGSTAETTPTDQESP